MEGVEVDSNGGKLYTNVLVGDEAKLDEGFILKCLRPI